MDNRSQHTHGAEAPHSQPTSLDAALAYASCGWHVFPADLSGGRKKSHKSKEHSDGANWGKTTDPEQIRRDHVRWPGAGVGIATGAESKIFVVEADTAEGHGIDGIAWIKALEEKHGPLPPTLMAVSPSGSVHRYFNWPTGASITNSASKVAPGVDVRGEGGMVIAPPSIRRDGGSRMAEQRLPPLADAPRWLHQPGCSKAPDNVINFPRSEEGRAAPRQTMSTDAADLHTRPRSKRSRLRSKSYRRTAARRSGGGSPPPFTITSAAAKMASTYFTIGRRPAAPRNGTSAATNRRHSAEGTCIHIGTLFHYRGRV